jgi:hypothetical protein
VNRGCALSNESIMFRLPCEEVQKSRTPHGDLLLRDEC